MKIEEAVQILLAVARHPVTNEVDDDDALHASDVVEDFFVNNVFDD